MSKNTNNKHAVSEITQLQAIIDLAEQEDFDGLIAQFERSKFYQSQMNANDFGELCNRLKLSQQERTLLATVIRLHRSTSEAEKHLARGLLHFHQRRFAQALSEFLAAKQGSEGNPEVTILLARTHARLGQQEESSRILKATLALHSDHAGIQLEVGKVLMDDLRDVDAGLKAIEKSIDLDATVAQAHFTLGNLQKDSGQRVAAIVSYSKVLALDPQNIEALNNKGACLQVLGNHQEAIENFDKALAINPNHLFAMMNKGTSLHKLNRFDESLTVTSRAFAIDPQMPEVLHNYGINLIKLGRHEEALEYFRSEILIAPNKLDVHLSLGNALHSLHKYQEAIEVFQDAINLDPNYIDAYINMAGSMQELGRHCETIELLNQALDVRPDYSDVLWNKSNSMLAFGPSQEAWEAYEHRLRISTWDPIPDLGLPLLSETDNQDGSLVVQWEQRFGDVIQMLRYVPAMEEKFDCHWQLTKPMADLARASFPDISIIGRNEVPEGAELRTPYTSLPLNSQSFAFDLLSTRDSYLTAPEANSKKWLTSLPDLAQKVGLTWRGNVNPPGRTMPLQEMETILSRFGTRLISLQMDITDKEADILKRHDVLHVGDEIETFADSAAIVENMELVISIDTALAHLAGAVGTDVWVLLKYGCDWRWYLKRSNSPWYPSAKLYRQQQLGDWSHIIENVAADLSKRW